MAAVACDPLYREKWGAVVLATSRIIEDELSQLSRFDSRIATTAHDATLTSVLGVTLNLTWEAITVPVARETAIDIRNSKDER